MQIAMILCEGFPMLDHALTAALVRSVNRAAGDGALALSTTTVTAAPVTSREGIAVTPDDGADWTQADLLLVAGGREAARYLPMRLRDALRLGAQRGATLGGLGHGAHVLSALGYLDGHRAVLPPAPEPAGPFTHEDADFVHDGARLTCRGGLATGAALLDWLAGHTTPALAQAAARGLHARGLLVMPDGGASDAAATMPSDPAIGRMKAIMGAHISTPLSLTEIARRVGLSPKQLRTRCQRLEGASPARVYVALRLERARLLVERTARPVAEIASAAGFDSASSFTRSFREHFDVSPRDLRMGAGPCDAQPAA
ncbi:GlxA family transcriptional regulator [Citreimonas salinaria]|uniref:Transcriptional regulator, AraC family with amidase-like domain n=1 Tax=Citreimonas salinaria TaxID=321339 RepID=A0A1H3GFK0_9RHOB|nr:helix-turn-helix domain-containing protein [Citreimonas salinaria]SDY02051.1 transcriptional regulator, AraC family with amidase-like domain [Citreimonas salinaria]